ncbi:MAG: hypothetical protein QOH96_2697 [Blastocatellia bacterium]|jgi:hypothetical protein|nr:hypothetical protein [Blastocatellia bacterium]
MVSIPGEAIRVHLGFLLSEFSRFQKYVPVIGTLNFVNPDLTSSGDDNLTGIS